MRRALWSIAVLVISTLVAACAKSDVPKKNAGCDVNKYDYVCSNGALWECNPRSARWQLLWGCGGAGGCQVTSNGPDVAGSPSCDRVTGDVCGYASALECSADGKAVISCDDGKVTRTDCPAGCQNGTCQAGP